jgi:hypothetical protein
MFDYIEKQSLEGRSGALDRLAGARDFVGNNQIPKLAFVRQPALSLALSSFLLLLPVSGWSQPLEASSPTPVASATAAVLETAAKADVTVKASLDKTEIEIGQSARVTVDISCREGCSLPPLEPDKWEVAPFEIQDVAKSQLPSEVKTIDGAAVTIQRTRYVLRVSAFEEGDLSFPSLPVNYVKDNETLKANSNPLKVKVGRVASVEQNPKEPPDIRDLKALMPSPFPPALMAAIAAALAILGWLVYRLVAWIRRPKPVKIVPKLHPFEQAQQDLAQLANQRRWESGEFEAYYDDLTLVLRQYLGWRFGVPLLESTTSEILDLLKDHKELAYDSWREMKLVLEQADLVKFAALRPEGDVPLKNLEKVKELVLQNPPQAQKGGS